MTTLTTEELVKKAYHAGVVRWDVAKELVELIVQTEREACAKIPRQHALEMVDGIFGKRFPDEAIAVLRATDAMAEKIKARGKQ